MKTKPVGRRKSVKRAAPAKQKTLTLKRMVLLFLSGVGLGLVMISMGWAADSAPKKHTVKSHVSVPGSKPKRTRAVVRRHTAHHTVAVASAKKHHAAAAHKTAPQIALKSYSHPGGLYKVGYPANWKINENATAMVATGGRPGQQAVFGIVKREDDQPNEKAISKELSSPNRPQNLTKSTALVAGLRATKLVSSGAPANTRKVEYYVESFSGHQYYILMMAPQKNWARYNVAFSKMLGTLTLN